MISSNNFCCNSSLGLVTRHYQKMALLAFGGNFYQDLDNQQEYLRSIEKWNSDSETWTPLTEDKIDEPKSNFGSLSVPSRLLCQ